MNAAGNGCLNDCNEFGETLESNQSNQCGINCASVGKILNAAGDKCLADCSIEGEFTNAEGSACLINCRDGGEITNAAGNNDFTCFIVCQHLEHKWLIEVFSYLPFGFTHSGATFSARALFKK